jgi:PAS domain S-box-containing protein
MSAQNLKTILLVDDDLINAMITSKIIKSSGYNVITANTGEEAINIFNNPNSINLILMDIDLGAGIDGTEAAAIILKDYDVPVVFLSSHTEPEIVEKTEKITSYGYVVKGCGTTVLDASIKMAFKLFEANKKILDSEVKQNSMISNISDVIAIIDKNGVNRYKSSNIQKWFGWSPDEVIGVSTWKNIHPDHLENIQQFFGALLREPNATGTAECLYQCKDGSYKWIEFTATNLTNDPIINGVLLNYHDITDRKRMEEATYKSEAQKNAILNGITTNIAFVDNNLKIIWANKAAAQSVNKSPDEMMGKTCYGFWADPSKPCLDCPTIKAFQTKKTEQTIIYTPDGRVWEEKGEPVFDANGNLIGVAEIATDITERKHSENALKRSEENYRLIVENSHDIIYTINTEGILTFISNAWTVLLGHPTFQVNGKPFQQFVHQDDLASCMVFLQKVIETGKRQDGVEYRVRHIDGSWRWHTSSAVPFKDESGAVAGFYGIASDITEHKLAEEKIKALLVEKTILLKEVHHRIKNNMNTVAGIMSLQMDALKEPTAIEALKDARSRVLSMMLLYDKLYRCDDFKETSFKEYFIPLVDEIVGNFPNKGIVKIEKNIDDFMIDAKRLSHLGIIINELLTNTMKYAFAGRTNGLINVSSIVSGNKVTIAIADNGIGIPESIDIATSSGFGLELLDIMTKQLKGTMKIERNNGTNFILKFNL